ncbi:MAG: hypothetical protein R6U52_01510 [Kosmotogaceae bacterium]
MSSWTLANIMQKIRRHTGRLSADDISNTELKDRINKYYTLRFPAEVKLEQKHVYYEFLTSANQPTYDVPDTTYTNYEPPATINNLSLLWYQDSAKFNNENPLQYNFTTPWTGDGATVTFTTTVQSFPIYPSTLTITDNTETFEDTTTTYTTSDISLTGSLGGSATINYSTGAISVTFNAAPSDGQNIYLNYVQFQPNRPNAILYFENKFQLSPVPDQVYRIRMRAYKIVSELTDATDTPDINEWGPCIVYGTSLGIFSDYGETNAYAETTALHKEQISLILTRTEQDLMNTRTMPKF